MMLSRSATKRRLPPTPPTTSLFNNTTTSHVIEAQKRCYSSLMTHQNYVITSSSSSSCSTNATANTANNHLHHFTQYRFKRNDGSKAFFKQSKVDRKGLKHDKRRKARQHQEKVGKHNAPGSKAGPQRQWLEEETQRLVNSRHTKRQDFMEELPEYGLKDALLDDLMGNTSHLSATPSPQPIYLGDYHEPLVQQTTKALEKYEAYVAKLEAATTDEQKAAIAPVPPPNDRQVSLVLRAYRDKNGTKAKPIGLHKALKHVVEELRLPTTLFGQESYTTLLTCCRTPKEAAQVMKLMQQRDVPVCGYSWSILIDIHSRLGDFQGCDAVMAEMKAAGVPPELPAYTSLLAACFKVCNAGHISSSVRSKAGALGWEKWKEMRVSGVEADAMAYGAILRLLAARGRAEQAINILDEMKHFQVKPTTMCFTAALKAVARSHEISIRFENGASRRFRRREKLTLYHGRMTRDIVVKAEQAEVVQDDGFVAALMLCAAAAGDSATAKAILLASEVRRMDHLRTIGPETHLAALRGVVEPQDIVNGLAQVSGGIKTLVLPETVQQQWLAAGGVASVTGAVTTTGGVVAGISPTVSSLLDPRKSRTAFEEREFGGKDSRVLTALMKACSSAIDPKGLGDMWAGKNNKGYLHENSLRLVANVQKPRYADNSIPGMSGTEVGLTGMNLQDEGVEEMSKRLRRAKYEGGKEDMDVGFDMDTVDPVYYKMYEGDYNERLDALHEDTVRRLHMIQGRDWTGMPEPNLQLEQAQLELSEEVEEPAFVKDINRLYYDASSGKFKQRKGNEEEEGGFSWDEEAAEWKFKEPSARNERIGHFEKQQIKEVKQMETSMEAKEEWYFDQEDMRWKSKIVYPGEVATAVKPAVKAPNHNNSFVTKDVDKPEVQEEYYFDQNDLKWKTRTKTAEAELTSFEKEALAKIGVVVASPRKESNQPETSALRADEQDEGDGSPFSYNEFRELMANETMSEKESRDMYESMKHEFIERLAVDPILRVEARDLFGIGKSKTKASDRVAIKNQNESPRKTSTHNANSFMESHLANSEYIGIGRSHGSLGDVLKTTPEMGGSAGFYDPDGSMAKILNAAEIEAGVKRELDDIMKSMLEDSPDDEESISDASYGPVGDYLDDEASAFPVKVNEEKTSLEYDLEDLQAVLPGMPRSRLLKVREAFRITLSYPSMIQLVPILRENMPDLLNNAWLKRKNILNAYFCVQKAKEDNLIDRHMVNGMLQVVTSAGKVGRALAVHDEQFKGYGIEPNEYSDRLIVQMLVKNQRLSRALEFKQKIEADGRNMDLASYGSVVEYYAKREQVGSALMMLRECVAVHGAPPKEGDMKLLRLLCRQQDILNETGLVELAGPDPLEWIRHGESNHKRESSKKGRRGVQEALNGAIRI